MITISCGGGSGYNYWPYHHHHQYHHHHHRRRHRFDAQVSEFTSG